MSSAAIKYIDHDHHAHLSRVRAGLTSEKRDGDPYTRLYNDGDEEHLMWMADKLLNDVCDLHKECAENLAACIEPWAQAAE
ncbi:hypothetical protein NLM27_42560 [Bradyrhizobium sp. CCGB12]|uniref:hypothetical protein n=1 Tax=Bradyrhizobium sp. CCGB12 TaxID=2949632 RepID=UPI0020B1E33E|nr:hypothetical protein [Bradyrhizobium sp. CCGB12]MCP3395404.1 hypothetical protein [Bradyrhizobium sp. CCGB12]